MVPDIVDDLVIKCMTKFLDAHYMVYIYPMPNGYCIMAMKIGKQGAHYLHESLAGCIVGILKHMQENDEELRGLVAP